MIRPNISASLWKDLTSLTITDIKTITAQLLFHVHFSCRDLRWILSHKESHKMRPISQNRTDWWLFHIWKCAKTRLKYQTPDGWFLVRLFSWLPSYSFSCLFSSWYYKSTYKWYENSTHKLLWQIKRHGGSIALSLQILVIHSRFFIKKNSVCAK